MNADHIRKLQSELKKQNFEKVMKKHMDNVSEIINFSKKDKCCIYTIDNFIPGMPLYDTSIVLKHISKRLKKEGYGVEQVSENQIKITWRLSNKEKLKEHIQLLFGSIYEMIKKAIVQNKSTIEYTIPMHIRYHPEHVQYYLITILKKKKFNVKVIKQGELEISW